MCQIQDYHIDLRCSKKTLFKNSKKHIDFHASKYKNKELMTKVNFLNQAESFMSVSYISQLYGNAHKGARN